MPIELTVSAAEAVEWPTDPITFVSHGPEGTGPWLMLRALADGMLQAGATQSPTLLPLPGQDGADSIRRTAAGEGEWLLASCTPTWLTTPVVHDMPQTIDTFTPVAGLVADSYLLVVAADRPEHNAVDLFARDTVVAAPKRGGNTDIQAALIAKQIPAAVDVKIIHDQPDINAALLDGSADWTTGVYSDFAAELAAGSLRMLATFDTKASESGSARTLREQGVDVEFPLWRGVLAPGSAHDRLDRWTSMITAATAQPAWTQYLVANRQRDAYLSPEAFGNLLAAENERYVRWLREMPTD